jgi:hypothetical protein
MTLTCAAGEGQYRLIPKRPDPLGADATLQYAVIGSTALAATYTSIASSYGRRVHPAHATSKPALFIRSSARLGVWAGALGVALNWHYYNAFVGVIMAEQTLPVKPWRLYERTQRLTVDDGCLAGAALGLAASIPTLFMRRPAIPRWTRCLGMTNIGACAGILGAHGYLQYNGERQRAYQRLDQRWQRRSMEFWGVFWDKELMARFNPLVQLYIRHNAVWYASHITHDGHEVPAEDDNTMTKSSESSAAAIPVYAPPEEIAYYTPSSDYAEYIKHIDVESDRAEIQALETEREALLKETEYMLILSAQKKYRYYHSNGDMDPDERERYLRELHHCELVYNRLSAAASQIHVRITKMRLILQHKAIVDAHPSTTDVLESWLPQSRSIDEKSHDPTISIQELEKLHMTVAEEVKLFEEWIASPGNSEQQRERWRKDLEDGRVLMKAAEHVMWELERVRERVVREALQRRSREEGEIEGEKRDKAEKMCLSEGKEPKTDAGGLTADKS